MKVVFRSALHCAAFVFALLLSACNSSSDASSLPNTSETTAELSPTVVYDSTMYIGSVKVGFTSLPLPHYYGYEWVEYNEQLELELIKDNPGVIRNGWELTFKVGNRATKTLVDVPYDETRTDYDPIMESVTYHFRGVIKNANAYQIDAHCYEYSYSLMLSKLNGDTLKGIGDFSCSTHGTWVLSNNFDLEAQYTPNGLELFQKEGNRYQRIGRKLLESWGVTSATWLNDSVVRLRTATFDEAWNQRFTFVDMTILE